MQFRKPTFGDARGDRHYDEVAAAASAEALARFTVLPGCRVTEDDGTVYRGGDPIPVRDKEHARSLMPLAHERVLVALTEAEVEQRWANPDCVTRHYRARVEGRGVLMLSSERFFYDGQSLRPEDLCVDVSEDGEAKLRQLLKQGRVVQSEAKRC